MAEVLVQFDEPYHDPDGRAFVAQVCGQSTHGGLWEGWVQFMPADGGDPVKTRRQTEQLSRGDLRYWTAGLTRDRLLSLLFSALTEHKSATPWRNPGPLVFDDIDPAERIVFDSATLSRNTYRVDPFLLYAQGEQTLRQQLRLLDATQLREIVSHHHLAEMNNLGSARTFEESLVDRIVAAVQQRVEDGHLSAHRYPSRTSR